MEIFLIIVMIVVFILIGWLLWEWTKNLFSPALGVSVNYYLLAVLSYLINTFLHKP